MPALPAQAQCSIKLTNARGVKCKPHGGVTTPAIPATLGDQGGFQMTMTAAQAECRNAVYGVTGAAEALVESAKQQKTPLQTHGAVRSLAEFNKLLAALEPIALELRNIANTYEEIDGVV